MATDRKDTGFSTRMSVGLACRRAQGTDACGKSLSEGLSAPSLVLPFACLIFSSVTVPAARDAYFLAVPEAARSLSSSETGCFRRDTRPGLGAVCPISTGMESGRFSQKGVAVT